MRLLEEHRADFTVLARYMQNPVATVCKSLSATHHQYPSLFPRLPSPVRALTLTPIREG